MTLPTLEAPPDDVLRIILFGPGYGESLIFGTARSGWIVIDSLAADDDEGETVNPAYTLLDDAGVNWTMLLLTHPHKDHVLGMAELINRPDPGMLACVQRFVPVPAGWDADDAAGEDPGATAKLGQKERALMAMRTMWARLPEEQRWDPRAGEERELGDVHLRCLWPTQDAVTDFDERHVENRLSCALLVSWRDHRLLLGADVLSAQWKKIAEAVSPEALAAHRLMKVPHHGSDGAVIEALDGTAGDRLWVLTPWDHGWRLPRFETEQGVALLHEQHPVLHLTSLPFRAPSPADLPFDLTREQARQLREAAKLPDQKAVASAIPRPVRDGWLDIAMHAGGDVRCVVGPAAGTVSAG